MPTTDDFFTYALWMGAVAIAVALLAILGFIFKWPLRFNLVGATGFSLVLTAGLFSLSLVPFVRATVPGAVRYVLTYDNGSTQATIAVPAEISETELDATLRQAASNLFSYGRFSQGDENLTVRARTIVHPEEGVSEPLYLGRVRRSLRQREDETMEITLDRAALARRDRLYRAANTTQPEGFFQSEE